MTKLTDAQLVVLSAACQRDDRCVYPLTTKAKGEAAAKILKSLLKKQLIEEAPAHRPAHRGGNISYHVWREGKDGALTLRATDAALDALGITREATPAKAGRIAAANPRDEVPGGDGGLVGGTPADQGIVAAKAEARAASEAGARKRGKKDRAAVKKAARGTKAKAAAGTKRAESKQARLIEMLKRARGASIAEIVEAFGWQPHTVRGAIAGALKKKLGLDVTSEKVDGRGRVYRLAA